MATATEVRERPILFNAEMVNAILDGRKTQTRRVVDPRLYIELTHSEDPGSEPMRVVYQSDDDFGAMAVKYARCPYGRPGDRLWVRETMYVDRGRETLVYAADDTVVPRGSFAWESWMYGYGCAPKKVPSIHMPRWASRILLEITDVRVERLQEIKPGDVFAEGVGEFVISSPDVASEMFARLWNSINEARGYRWDANPWVWVVGFRRIEP